MAPAPPHDTQDIPAGDDAPPDAGAPPSPGTSSWPRASPIGRGRRPALACFWPLALLLVVSVAVMGLSALSHPDRGAEGPTEESAEDPSPPDAPPSLSEKMQSSDAATRAVGGARLVLLALGACVLFALFFARVRGWLLPPPRLALRATWGLEQLAYGFALTLAFATLAAQAGVHLSGMPSASILLGMAGQITIAAAVVALVLTRPSIMPGVRYDTNTDAQDAQDGQHGEATPRESRTSLLNTAARMASLGVSLKGTGPNALRGIVGGLGAASLAFVAAVCGSLVSEWAGTPPPMHPVIEKIASAPPLETVVLVVSACVVAPVVEEIFFRGFIYPVLRERWGVLAGAAASALAFAAVHPPGLPGKAATFVLGICFALLYERSGTLVAPVVAHALFNGIQIALVLVVRVVG